ncbi:MAG: hypothetical protein HKN76_03550, partial [Saprospiraceae bacterium]|nr:hypothetical protein [Saprospiraceae bacterium]
MRFIEEMTEAQVRNIKIFGESIEKFIETHISFVILTKAHAYKIKKAIQFSFLDFSSIAKRKFYCDQELKLNQRLAGDMYLDVVPVRQKDGQFLIHSQTGAIADHALQMRRMDNRKEMHRMLQSHSVTHADIVKIAEILVNFHRSLPGIMEPLDARALKDIFNDIRSIEGILNRDFAGKYTGLVSQVRSFSDHFIDSHSTVLEERIRRGLIKDCHG